MGQWPIVDAQDLERKQMAEHKQETPRLPMSNEEQKWFAMWQAGMISTESLPYKCPSLFKEQGAITNAEQPEGK